MSLTRATRLAFAALVATVVMGATASAATATTGMSITNGVSLASANGQLTFTVATVAVVCNTTLGLQMNPTFTKTVNSTISTVLLSGAGSSFTNCSFNSTVTLLNGVSFGYTSFVGTLPNITRINGIANSPGLLVTVPGLLYCLFGVGRLPVEFSRNAATGVIDSLTLNATSALSSIGPGPNCRSLSAGSVRGTLAVLATKPIVQLI